MSSTEDRVKALIAKQFDMEVNMDEPLPAAEITSLDKLAFLKSVAKEFQVPVASIDLDQIENIRELVNFLDSHD